MSSMKKIGDVLGNKYRGIGKVVKVRSLWTEIAGEVLASHTEPVLVSSGTLHVLCDSPAWVQQVRLLADPIVEQVKKLAGIRITKIDATFGIPRRPPEAPKRTQVVFRPPIDPADIERIADERLAQLMRALVNSTEHGDG